MVSTNTCDENLDQEWVELISEAYRIGLSPEEVRRFIEQKSKTHDKSS